jgi:hypothetical protein
MNHRTIGTLVLAAVLACLAVLPVAAGGTPEAMGRAVAPSAELAAFFEERGVDPQHLGKARAEVPPEQWSRMNAIVATPDVEDSDTVEVDYGDDHDVLNTLVYATLSRATDTVGDSVYLRIGNASWGHTLTEEDDDADTDMYGFPTSDSYPTPRA